MKYKLLIILALGFLVAAGVAVAGKGGKTTAGFWVGSGEAIYPDGTGAEITLVEVLLYQDGDFIHGEAEFTVKVGEADPGTFQGQMSGHISGNSVKGIFGGCFPEAPDCLGASVFEGKLHGNKLTGTVLDLSDGSTSVLSLNRIAD